MFSFIKKSWSTRLKDGLQRTRNKFSNKLSNLILGKKIIDDDLFEDLETLLLSADVGVEATQKILDELTAQVSRKALTNPEALAASLKKILVSILKPCEQPLEITAPLFVILMVGVNGAGKTTSIAKLAHFYQEQGKQVMLAAGDTFRAAAVEQLQVWGERNNVPVIAQKSGADSASVIYDAMQSAKAKQRDLLIADTAGRLHTQDNLMAELEKIKRVMRKLDADAPQEVMLIIDAGMGQNALNQAQQFHKTIGLTSISITKLDGTARGGIIFAIANKLQLPIRFIGIGEQIDDLKPFNAEDFVDALFETSKE
jgi:fused signal recognition particle receptor